MYLEISHTTRYRYGCPVRFHPHLLYLRPRDNPLLEVTRYRLTVRPEGVLYWMRDDFDNLPASVRIEPMSSSLEIHAECRVMTMDIPPFDFLVRDYARQFPFGYEPLHRFNLGIYLALPDEPTQAAVRRWVEPRMEPPPQDTVGWLFALNQVLFRGLEYRRRDEAGIQTPLQTIWAGSGSCRDFASLFVACARTFGVAARFVSGYMFDPTHSPEAAGDMHAWAEVFLPGAGWRGLDPTYGLFCHNAYVPVAHAVVAESINPVQGSFYSPTPTTAILSSDVRIRQVTATPLAQPPFC